LISSQNKQRHRVWCYLLGVVCVLDEERSKVVASRVPVKI